MKKLTLDNLDDLAVGSAILGSGGGGDPTYPYASAKYEIEKHGQVSLINVSEIKSDDLIVSVGFMGTSLVEAEKLPSGREFSEMFTVLEENLGKKINAVMPFEIGGGNAFTPLMVGAIQRLPILDADTMGRAFPEFHMSSCNLFGINPSPGFLTDSLGNTVVIHTTNSHTLEKIGRQVSVAMGSCCAFGVYPFTGSEAKKCTLHKSISKAISIGKAHREAKNKGLDPLEAILTLCKGVCIGSGKIIDVDRAIFKGFLNGKVIVENRNEKIEVIFQNEYLIVKVNGKIIATTPDILMLMEQETGKPITSESLQFGLKVNVIALPAPSTWTTPEGLALVGPRYFGYEIDYQPVVKSKNPSNIGILSSHAKIEL